MGLLIISCILLAIGVFGTVGYTVDWHNSEVTIGVGVFGWVLWVIMLIVLGLFLIAVQTAKVDAPISYQKVELFVDYVANNTNPTPDELSKAIDRALNYNSKILRARGWRDSFWVGLYHSEVIADMELIDITRLKGANPKSSIDIKLNNN